VPFDDPNFLTEWKVDGFRSLANIDDGQRKLVVGRAHSNVCAAGADVRAAHANKKREQERKTLAIFS
jgi:ATP-dependent DNA ligase